MISSPTAIWAACQQGHWWCNIQSNGNKSNIQWQKAMVQDVLLRPSPRSHCPFPLTELHWTSIFPSPHIPSPRIPQFYFSSLLPHETTLSIYTLFIHCIHIITTPDICAAIDSQKVTLIPLALYLNSSIIPNNSSLCFPLPSNLTLN